ncbi:hypothetical protein [Paraglaciecola sp.]|uniref:hypothetical protein n=1 Tax=Paraglaciecola sp. TaxID=1920173 RepID=UPI0032668CD1
MKILPRELGVILVLLSSCSNHYTVNDGGQNQQQCKSLRSSCTLGMYDEWEQANGEASCSCHRNQSSHTLN